MSVEQQNELRNIVTYSCGIGIAIGAAFSIWVSPWIVVAIGLSVAMVAAWPLAKAVRSYRETSKEIADEVVQLRKLIGNPDTAIVYESRKATKCSG